MTDDEALLVLARTAVGVSTRAAAGLGRVSLVQLRALTLVRELAGPSLARLAAELGVTVSTTSRLVERLVAAGLVDRHVVPTNRRAVELRPTAAGAELLARYDEARLRELRTWLDAVPPSRRGAVSAALADLAAAAGPAGTVRPGPRHPARDERAAPDEPAGDPVCWLDRVCPACGRLAEGEPRPDRCPECGELLPDG